MSETKFVHFITPHETLEIPVEAVSDPTEIAKGLMNRFYFADNSGFLFEFGKETRQSFWMKDTRIPLSIAFIDKNGSIIAMQHMDAFSTEPVNSPAPYVAALEVHQGFFEKHEIKVNDKVKIENNAHPVRIGEVLNYDGEHAEATRHGLEDHDELTLWDDVDWGLVTLPRPRVIKSNKPLRNRNHLAFKFVSFIKKGTATVPDYWTRLRHPSPSGLDAPGTPQELRRAGRPIDDDRLEESWRNIDDIYQAHGASLETFSGELSKLAKAAIERGKTDQLAFHRAARANDFEPQDVIDMGTGMHGFSRHAMASTIALFSPKQRMYGGKSHHNNTLHQSIMAMDIVGRLGSSAGLEITQDHINQIEKTKAKLRAEIAVSKEGRARALQQHLDSIKTPTVAGTYNINDFSDHGILAMIPGGGSYGSKLAGIQMLTSEKREGARPLRIEEVIKRKNGLITIRDPETGKKIKGEKAVKHEIGMQSGPKVVSFAHNLEFPDESDSFTSDARIKSLLKLNHDKYSIYCGSNCARPSKDTKPKLSDDEDYDFESEAGDDPYAEDEGAWGTAGWDAIDLRSDVRRGQGDWPASKSHPGKSFFYGPGAGYQWQGAAADLSFRDIYGGPSTSNPIMHGVEMNIQRFQNSIWPETILGGSFGTLDPRAKDLEKERLATSLDEFYLPKSTKEHVERGESTSLACRHVHPYLELAKQVRAKRLSGLSVVRDPSTIRSVLRSSAGDTLDFGSASAPRIQIQDKSPKQRERIEVSDGAFTSLKTPGKSKTKTSPKTKTTPKSKGEKKTTPKTKKKPTKKSPTKKTPTKKVVKKKVVKKRVVKKKVVKKEQPKTLKPKN